MTEILLQTLAQTYKQIQIVIQLLHFVDGMCNTLLMNSFEVLFSKNSNVASFCIALKCKGIANILMIFGSDENRVLQHRFRLANTLYITKTCLFKYTENFTTKK